MEKKSLLRLVVILLALSYVAAVPATRNLVAKKVDPSAQDHHAKEALDLKSSTEEVFEMEEGAEGGRKMMDVGDYHGPRANPRHDPKPPGKPRV